MQKALFRTSCLAFVLAVSAPAGFGDDAATGHTLEKHDETPVKTTDVIESRTVQILGYVTEAAKLLDDASKSVLAGDGDRSTAKARREAAAWMAKTARGVVADLDDLKDSEEDFTEITQSHETALKSSYDTIEAELKAFQTELATLKAKPGAEAVSASLPKLEEAGALLEKALKTFTPVRDVTFEMEFVEVATAPDVMKLVADTLIAAAGEKGMHLSLDEAALGVKLVLKGDAPADTTAFDVRSTMVMAFNELEIQKAVEATEPVQLPKPAFMAVTLD